MEESVRSNWAHRPARSRKSFDVVIGSQSSLLGRALHTVHRSCRAIWHCGGSHCVNVPKSFSVEVFILTRISMTQECQSVGRFGSLDLRKWLDQGASCGFELTGGCGDRNAKFRELGRLEFFGRLGRSCFALAFKRVDNTYNLVWRSQRK